MELHEVGFYKKSRLAGAGTAYYQHIFIAGMSRILRPAGHHKPLGLCQDNVVFRFRVHKRGNICFVAPAGAPVFHIFAVLFGILSFKIDCQPHNHRTA